MKTNEMVELVLLEKQELHSSYEQGDFTAVPNGKTKFFRTFLPWQMFRFFWINLRMMVMIFKSHH
ncbi:hypothetical protein EHR01_06750 [Leptospira mtsangambouensis]|uniref:Uncharacterized protein n=1 Tax=Leptospira mtsangambouensis TaxID=2484912 RepID=A0ABY2P0I6_9LEPT|nr:hypothetical protein [Leptospira mtsangambouensis]MCG6141692.1 hypothetical protein [Leptospira mtsangambouensis]TGM78160.1 hypothetical protein EHR01_06750 [Leptospira mtsangambouensis]